LLSCIKPILAHLSSPNPVNEDEDMSKEAKAAIGNYMDILDVRLLSYITPFDQFVVQQDSTISSHGLSDEY
jgi:hypothetical protein